MSQIKKFCKNININLFPKQLDILEQFYGGKFRELVAVLGRRSGKDTISNIIALHAVDFLTNMEPYGHYNIATGNPIYVMWLSTSVDQARIGFADIKLLVHSSAYLQRTKTIQVEKDEIIFYTSKGEVRLLVTSAASKRTLGKRIFTLILNEAACFRDLQRVRSTLLPSTEDFADPRTGEMDSKIAYISSPRGEGDKFHELFLEDSSNRLCVQHATWNVNPNMTREYLEHEFKCMDMNEFRAEFGAEFLTNLSNQTVSLRLPGKQIEELKKISRQIAYEQDKDFNYTDLIRESIERRISDVYD